MREEIIKILDGWFKDAYFCTKVWEAWGYNTMTQNDFVPVDDEIEEAADEIIKIIANNLEQHS